MNFENKKDQDSRLRLDQEARWKSVTSTTIYLLTAEAAADATVVGVVASMVEVAAAKEATRYHRRNQSQSELIPYVSLEVLN